LEAPSSVKTKRCPSIEGQNENGAGDLLPLKVVELSGRRATPELSTCLSALDPEAPVDYRELAALLACEWLRKRPRVVGLAGGQGAGKSTLGSLIVAACASVGIRVCLLGLDDFYLPRKDRLALARRIHPLFETRGAPGTHEMDRCRAAIRALRGDADVDLPVFDKGLDDRSDSRRVRGPFDVVLLEGWCVGAAPESDDDLAVPINALEKVDDAESVWRRYVNSELAGVYGSVWSDLEYLVYLRVPGLAAVRGWRLQQENSLSEAQRRGAEEIDRFVQHYERITLSMMKSMPTRADLVVGLAPDHSIATMIFRSP
jgi:D-glycerate 3-kinase